METVYSFTAKTLQGKDVLLEDYKGNVILIVNTASKCGFTPQYAGLEELYKEYSDKGVVVLAFPCNQFGKQEPGDAQSIAEGCLINYGVSFPVHEKICVNGAETHPLFKFLKKKLPGFLGGAIKWNFTKFLINSEGVPVKRYAPTVTPDKIRKDIDTLVQKN